MGEYATYTAAYRKTQVKILLPLATLRLTFDPQNTLWIKKWLNMSDKSNIAELIEESTGEKSFRCEKLGVTMRKYSCEANRKAGRDTCLSCGEWGDTDGNKAKRRRNATFKKLWNPPPEKRNRGIAACKKCGKPDIKYVKGLCKSCYGKYKRLGQEEKLEFLQDAR